MSKTPTYRDGELEYGSSQLTITPKVGRTNVATFAVIGDNEFTFDDSCKEVDQTDQWGQYNGGFGVPTKLGGSITIQLPSARRIYSGDTFTSDVDTDQVNPTSDGATATLFQVTKASNPHEKDNYRKQQITFFKRKYLIDNVTLNQPVDV